MYQYILERCFVIILLISATYYHFKLGLVVCFIIIIYLTTKQNNYIDSSIESFNANTNTNIENDEDCNIVKIPSVNINTYTIYTAIIVEPRKHKALPFVLQNFTENLSEEWNFMIYHGTENENMVKSIISSFSENVKNRITLINLKVKNLNISKYSTMFFCPTFMIIFQPKLF